MKSANDNGNKPTPDELARAVIGAIRDRWRALAINELETWAKAVINELRTRGLAVGIEGDRAHHADALRAVESLASSARVAELIQRAEPANDTEGS